jgi:hypothetical protein
LQSQRISLAEMSHVAATRPQADQQISAGGEG